MRRPVGLPPYWDEIMAPHKNLWVHMSYGRIEQVEIPQVFTGWSVLILQFMIESGYPQKVAKSFLRFQGSRPGLFYDLPARETCPLLCSPAPSEREPGLPPQISREKTAASHQSHSEKTSPPFFSPVSSHPFRPQILMRSQNNNFNRWR
jgi:hypothetical protein